MMAVPVVADVQALLDQPLELGKAVDDGVGLVRMSFRAREDLVDPGVIPSRAIKEDRGRAGPLGGDDVGRAVADVPAVRSG